MIAVLSCDVVADVDPMPAEADKSTPAALAVTVKPSTLLQSRSVVKRETEVRFATILDYCTTVYRRK